jgi:hypothetical protein
VVLLPANLVIARSIIPSAINNNLKYDINYYNIDRAIGSECQYATDNVSYLNAHNSPTGLTAEGFGVGQSINILGTYSVNRLAIAFDTSNVTGTITSAYLSFTTASFNNDADVHLCLGTYSWPTDNTSFFDMLETESYGSVSVNQTDDYTIDLDEFGIAQIDEEGMTLFALRTYDDMDTIAPTDETETAMAITTDSVVLHIESETSGSVVETLPATNIASTSATLNGNLLSMDNVSSLNVFFEYGISTSYGYTTPLVAQSATGIFDADITGLSVNVLYHFRAVAATSNVTYYGEDLTFTPTESGGILQMGGGNARVFYNYIVSGDMLFTAEIVNTYTPYYPTQSPKEYFTIQLIDTDNTTVLAATPQQDWGDKPVSIYLNPTQAVTITPRAAYSIRLQANFASNVTAQYTLQPSDWKGYDLTKLDDWCVYVALDMQTYYGGSGYVTVLTDRKLAITDAVGGYFTTGIPGIGQRRPNLFTTSQQSPAFNAGVSLLPVDNTTAYTAYVGTTISNDAAVFAVPFGLTGRDMLAGGMALAMLGVVATGTAAMGGFGALGLFLISIPFLWLATYFKIVGVQWIIILTIIFGLLAIRQFWIKTT